MACFHPLSAYRDRDGGAPRIGRRPSEEGDRFELPCGTCIGCRKDRARAWSLRIMHEAQSWDRNLFVTLSYSDDFLPRSLSLEYSDFQKFMKRLRRRFDGVSSDRAGKRPIRFFCAGEYGSLYQRPHFHAVLFNTSFPDLVRLYNGSFRSSALEEIWGKGACHIGELTAESAAYVAGYTVDKQYGKVEYDDVVDRETGEVFSRRPEFCSMSRRPGIGSDWFERFSADLFPHDFAIDPEGRKWKVPRYYRDRFEATADAGVVEDIRFRRYQRAAAVDREESSERRRGDREEVAWARVSLRRREH